MPVSFGTNEYLPAYVQTDITYTSLALAVLGWYLVTINQLSFYLKSKLFMSNALIALCIGIAVGPIGLNWISPWEWTNFDESYRFNLTFQITRIVIGIQVMFAGIDLPAAYLKREWLSLFILLLPIMTIAWFISAGFVMLFVPSLTFLECLAIAACITPTDPILANTIVKGRYAEKHVPIEVRNVLSAESGANDGLGYPFLFLALDLMQRTHHGHSINESLQHWVVTTWIYQIVLACALGFVIGWLARKTLKFAHNRRLIDHESFLAYGIGLALFTLGVTGILGSDDILACFVAGNSLTWRDFYRVEASEEDTFQDVIDGLLDTATFIYIGTIIPWSRFSTEYLTPWKLVLFAICILLFRRLPAMLVLYKFIPAVDGIKEGLFTGWFGPIGVSALYYAILAREHIPENRVALHETVWPVVIFMAMSSTIVHGITIPVSKAAPLAVKRTKSMTSARDSGTGFIARVRSAGFWMSVMNYFDPDARDQPETRQAPDGRNPTTSSRSSFERSGSTMQSGPTTMTGSPIEVGRTEGGIFEPSQAKADAERREHASHIERNWDVPASHKNHVAPVLHHAKDDTVGRVDGTSNGDLGDGGGRDSSGTSTPNPHKVEFSLPHSKGS